MEKYQFNGEKYEPQVLVKYWRTNIFFLRKPLKLGLPWLDGYFTFHRIIPEVNASGLISYKYPQVLDSGSKKRLLRSRKCEVVSVHVPRYLSCKINCFSDTLESSFFCSVCGCAPMRGVSIRNDSMKNDHVRYVPVFNKGSRLIKNKFPCKATSSRSFGYVALIIVIDRENLRMFCYFCWGFFGIDEDEIIPREYCSAGCDTYLHKCAN